MPRINRAERIRRKNKERFVATHPVKAGVAHIKWSTETRTNFTALKRQDKTNLYFKKKCPKECDEYINNIKRSKPLFNEKEMKPINVIIVHKRVDTGYSEGTFLCSNGTNKSTSNDWEKVNCELCWRINYNSK